MPNVKLKANKHALYGDYVQKKGPCTKLKDYKKGIEKHQRRWDTDTEFRLMTSRKGGSREFPWGDHYDPWEAVNPTDEPPEGTGHENRIKASRETREKLVRDSSNHPGKRDQEIRDARGPNQSRSMRVPHWTKGGGAAAAGNPAGAAGADDPPAAASAADRASAAAAAEPSRRPAKEEIKKEEDDAQLNVEESNVEPMNVEPAPPGDGWGQAPEDPNWDRSPSPDQQLHEPQMVAVAAPAVVAGTVSLTEGPQRPLAAILREVPPPPEDGQQDGAPANARPRRRGSPMRDDRPARPAPRLVANSGVPGVDRPPLRSNLNTYPRQPREYQRFHDPGWGSYNPNALRDEPPFNAFGDRHPPPPQRPYRARENPGGTWEWVYHPGRGWIQIWIATQMWGGARGRIPARACPVTSP